ncbi:zinc finger CCCH-type with G patch domain-containing protein-like [Tubulanus polymorphus]|uniref:zinc finger CCCH-type with G patch domain-containing protein-like n=1 Tax=Tubulanus polymorphus TaxID=672921 RepID=UPI003DA68EAE
MDEDELKESIDLYQLQLGQVTAALDVSVSTENNELQQLKTQLIQLIQLTKESLLNLKKSKLLQELESTTNHQYSSSSQSSTSNSSTVHKDGSCSTSQQDGSYSTSQKDGSYSNGQKDGSNQGSIDSEMVEFMQTTAEEMTTPTSCQSTGLTDDDDDDDEKNESKLEELKKQLIDLEGSKCRVVYRTDWAPIQHHNAIVLSAEPITSLLSTQLMVRVLFCNPTHQSMVPCPFFLNGCCKFNTDNCRYSHGYVVAVEELDEFKEPDFSQCNIGSSCLARYDDNIWYQATIVDRNYDNDTLTVSYDKYNNETSELQYSHIYPQDDEVSDDDENDDDDLSVYAIRPSKCTDRMGAWEAHTKGFGSRMMQRMGYITGQGLGKNGEGRAEPVPIHLIPAGKSLDKIMELKEKAGNKELFNVMKNKEKMKKTEDKKNLAIYLKSENKTSVFDFINKKLHGKKGDIRELITASGSVQSVGGGVGGEAAGRSSSAGAGAGAGSKHITERDLLKKSDHSLNIQAFKTQEEIRKVEKEIMKVKESIIRTKQRGEKKVTHQKQMKLEELETYLRQLKNSENSLQQHKTIRSNHKKLTIF